LAGALLAPMVTEQHIEHLERLINEMDRAAEAADHSAFNPLNLEFHDAIVEATGNSRLMKMYRGLVKEAHLFRTHGLVSQAAMVASNKEHRAIIKALKRRNSRECYDASFQHVANGKQRMLAALAKIENEDSPDQTEEVMAGGGRNASALK
jgi:DNA-binding GntR family transcriptional regulator